eukprot:gb/GEZJ01002197.1/.p1 GENE.gb/GEZJ01002197.1/~~gb/GEZJ01002197.1/.p1  ORF type:complete len:151 (-),score=8.53 gb/GEZJ01002197.1/:182-634(-)
MNSLVRFSFCTVLLLIVLCAPTGSHSFCFKDMYLSLGDDQLWAAAREGSRVGGCYIPSAGPPAFCDLYVKSAVRGSDGDFGWPKNRNNRGTGCVKAPELPRSRSHCFFNRRDYDLPNSELSAFCTGNGKANALAQLRHALRNNACLLPTC